MDSLHFSYDGISSEDMGLYLVNINSGLKPEPFLSGRELLMESIIGNDQPYFYGVQRHPLKLTLTFSLLDGLWTTDKRRQISRWLDNGRFNEFYSYDDVSKRYYLMCDSAVDLESNSMQQGYITVNFTNIAPYAFTPVYTKEYNCSLNPDGITEITFINEGDDLLYPELELFKIDAGDVSIVNLNNSGKEFKFTNLADAETVYVDNLHHHIESDLDILRYDNFNHNYLELTYGVNKLIVTGKCKLKLTYQAIIKG